MDIHSLVANKSSEPFPFLRCVKVLPTILTDLIIFIN